MILECQEYLSNKCLEPKQLVILLHGYGSNAYDLISIAPELAKYLPQAHFISPNAPLPFEGGGYAFQWFSLASREESFMLKGAREAEKVLNRFIDEQLNKFKLQSKNLALIGFSQGTMMALHTALRRPQPLTALLCYSGMLLGASLLENEIKSKPKVMLVHGAEDQVLPSQCMHIAQAALKNLNVDCQAILRPKLAHGIDREGIMSGGRFLSEVFGEKVIQNINII